MFFDSNYEQLLTASDGNNAIWLGGGDIANDRNIISTLVAV